MARLYAISDLHLRYPENRELLERLPRFPGDGIIVAGDVGETETELDQAWALLGRRFDRIVWVPGNHELWTRPGESSGDVGEAKYLRLLEICRRHGVLTPEDPYPLWEGEGGPCLLVPLFLLYDYSFRPDRVPEEQAVSWAAETGILCADEVLLRPDPYPSRKAWCHARLAVTEKRLEAEAGGHPLVLVNHFPLRYDLVRLRRVPRFSIWCGTRRTNDWHLRFGAKVVVSGHLHTRRTEWRDSVRFEEVSLGYPSERRIARPPESYLREILPGPPASG